MQIRVRGTEIRTLPRPVVALGENEATSRKGLFDQFLRDGQFQSELRVASSLRIVVPLTLPRFPFSLERTVMYS